MKYLFMLGRNPELSFKELESYFRKKGILYSDFKRNENSVLFDMNSEFNIEEIKNLGGTVAIGEVRCPIEELENTNIYLSSKNNFSYVLWNFSERTEEVSEYLKKRFKAEKLKASEKKLREELFFQGGEKGQNISSKIIDEQYFVFDNLFGEIVKYYDYKNVEERDMKKPVRRESLSISPRLAKIMINLSEVKIKGTLLDSFCGIGVVLSEALNQGIKVVGVDKDEKAISGCKENMKWFGFSNLDYKLINNDSSKVKLSSVDVMVSEPDFGKTLKKIPTKEDAKKSLKRFENIMEKVLGNVKKYVKGKIVFTSPYIRIVGKKRLGADLKKLAEKTGLKISEGFPLEEFRENQIVGRQIVVFER